MVQSLHEISTKALMQRIADELEGLIVADAEGRYAYLSYNLSGFSKYLAIRFCRILRNGLPLIR